MQARQEITRKFGEQYAAKAKQDNGRLPNEVGAITSWPRDNTRCQLNVTLKPRGVGKENRKPHPLKYLRGSLQTTARVAFSGKCLAASLELQRTLVESHGARP